MKEGWPEAVRRWKGALRKYQSVLLVIAVGVVLLLLPAGGSRDSPQPAEAREEGTSFDLEAFEIKLERVLSQVEGAGETRVVLTLDGGSRQVLARNQDRDGGGGSSNSVVTVGKGAGAQEVVPLQTVAPQFRGALVVCPGGGDAQVRLKLIEAVSALTGLGADKISVCAGG
ncbi:MAG: stage III sporulation protein AG [Lawsonibacter sp.]|nr:stage III sporulation protein AG [Lawsonibacter sp.]